MRGGAALVEETCMAERKSADTDRHHAATTRDHGTERLPYSFRQRLVRPPVADTSAATLPTLSYSV